MSSYIAANRSAKVKSHAANTVLRVLFVAFLGSPMPRRIFVRINGCADGGVAVSIGDNATKEEFLTKATSKLLRGQPDHVDASGALIYFEGGQYEADMEDLEANDKVVVALTGSPYKDKLSRPDEPGESHDVDPSATAGQPGPPALLIS